MLVLKAHLPRLSCPISKLYLITRVNFDCGEVNPRLASVLRLTRLLIRDREDRAVI